MPRADGCEEHEQYAATCFRCKILGLSFNLGTFKATAN